VADEHVGIKILQLSILQFSVEKPAYSDSILENCKLKLENYAP